MDVDCKLMRYESFPARMSDCDSCMFPQGIQRVLGLLTGCCMKSLQGYLSVRLDRPVKAVSVPMVRVLDSFHGSGVVISTTARSICIAFSKSLTDVTTIHSADNE